MGRACARVIGATFCIFAALVVSATVTVAKEATSSQAAPDCPAPKWMPERLDYYNPVDQMRIGQIEGNHFDAQTEALVRGITSGVYPGTDIEFLVRYVPNHPRGLAALVRLSFRDRTPKPAGMTLGVECYLVRALIFKPGDAEVEKIYGTYLAKQGRYKESLGHFKAAESAAPGDILIAYNLGLVYFELKDYEQARSYAQRAYAGGVSLPGLRDKLAKAGQWRE